MTIKNILVPTDFSVGSREALRYALDFGLALNAAVHLLHVVENPFAPGAFMEMYAPPPNDYFVNVEREAQEKLRLSPPSEYKDRGNIVMTTRVGVVATEILDRLHEEPKIDLVVMATHGRGGVARFVMGSVTDKIVRSAPCPVLTIREHPETVEAQLQEAAGASV